MKKIVVFVVLLISQTAMAKLSFVMPKQGGTWTLNNAASVLNFITTKNASKTEVQSFTRLDGAIKGTTAVLNVDLSSVDTGIKIRDQRLRDIFFKVIDFPQATVSVDIENTHIKAMKLGHIKNLTLNATVNIHGIEQELPVQVQVVAVEHNKRLVVTRQPLVIELKNFQLLKGVNVLREIAKLTSINSAVPITFSLLFTKATRNK